MENSNDNEMPLREILGMIATEDLIQELQKRKGVVCSVWNHEDVLPLMEDIDLDDETRVSVARNFLYYASDGLQDVLGAYGNAYLDDRFDRYRRSDMPRISNDVRVPRWAQEMVNGYRIELDIPPSVDDLSIYLAAEEMAGFARADILHAVNNPPVNGQA
jgi:hypothetical protein